MEVKTKTNNRLWLARHRRGLEQKQVAHLLGHKTCDQISRYERGEKLPSLQTALKLEIILRSPIRELFPELFETHRVLLAQKVPAHGFPSENQDSDSRTHICTFEVLTLQKKPDIEEIDLVRKHSIELIRKLSDLIHNRFS